MFCKNGGCAGIFLKLKETVSLLLLELHQIKKIYLIDLVVSMWTEKAT
jgi:hypothetical protein